MMNLSVWKSPNCPSIWKESNDELKISAVNVASMQQKKIIQPSFILQNDDTSSMANSKPPTGAPNAAATPAAAPAVVKFRLKNNKGFREAMACKAIFTETHMLLDVYVQMCRLGVIHRGLISACALRGAMYMHLLPDSALFVRIANTG